MLFLQECLNSVGIHWNPLESSPILVDFSSIPVESSGIQQNPAESSGIQAFLQESEGHQKVLGELGDLEYLPTKTQYTKYLQNADVRTSGLFGPFKWHYSRFK